MTDTLARMRHLVAPTSQWAGNDLVLGDGEIAFEVMADTTIRAKVGYAGARYSALRYLNTSPSVQLDDLGGKADWSGSSGTDNAPAFARAIAALPLTGGSIILGRGAYMLASQVTLPFPGHYQIIGQGNSEADNNTGATEIIKAASMTTPAIYVKGPRSYLAGFVLRGVSGNTGDGIDVGAHSVHMDRVSVYFMGQDGIRVGDTTSNCNLWHLAHCVSNKNGRHGYHYNDGSGSIDVNAGVQLNCTGNDNTGAGYCMNVARLNTVIGGDFERNGIAGGYYTSSSCGYCSLLGGDYEQNPAAKQILIDAGPVGINIIWPTCFDTDITDNGTRTRMDVPISSGAGSLNKGINRLIMGNPGGANDIVSGGVGSYLRMIYGGDAITDANAQVLISGAGLYLGKAGGKLGLFGIAPILQPTTAVAASVFAAGTGGTAITTASTFDGYTIQQLAKIIRSLGAAA